MRSTIILAAMISIGCGTTKVTPPSDAHAQLVWDYYGMSDVFYTPKTVYASSMPTYDGQAYLGLMHADVWTAEIYYQGQHVWETSLAHELMHARCFRLGVQDGCLSHDEDPHWDQDIVDRANQMLQACDSQPNTPGCVPARPAEVYPM